jgi:hypothetical protein
MRWKDVLDRVGESPAATMVYLYFDELARELGRRADDYGDPQLIMSALADEDGTVDGDILNAAEARAWARFRQEHGWRLGEPSWEEVHEVIWSLGC